MISSGRLLPKSANEFWYPDVFDTSVPTGVVPRNALNVTLAAIAPEPSYDTVTACDAFVIGDVTVTCGSLAVRVIGVTNGELLVFEITAPPGSVNVIVEVPVST